MREKKMYRVLWVISLFLVAAIGCNLLDNVVEAVEIKETADSVITQVESLITDVDMQAMETEIGAFATEFEGSGVMETAGAAITEIPELSGEKPADIPVIEGGTDVAGSSELVTYLVDDSVQEIIDFYEREMIANGWVKVDGQVESDYAELTYEKGGRTATVTVADIFIQRSVTITIEGG